MEKSVFTSGSFSFSAFDENGLIYSPQRIKEFIPLRISNIPNNGVKIVKLNHPSINFDLIFTQLRINKTQTTDITLQIDMYRGSDFVDRMILNDIDIPYEFHNGCVLDPHGHDYNNHNSIELRLSCNKGLDEKFLICEKCYIHPVLELIADYSFDSF